METASTRSYRSWCDSKASVPHRSAMAFAWEWLTSATPTRSTSGRADRMRACSLPRCPTPTTAIRMRFMLALSSAAADAGGSGPAPRLALKRAGEGPGQFHVQGVARPVGDHVADQVEAAQRQVADEIEDFVAGGLRPETETGG